MTTIDPRAVIERALHNSALPCITSSFQAECVVLTHMLREVQPDIPVLFLDTFHHFAQTYAYRDEMAAAWKMKLVTLQAAPLTFAERLAHMARRASSDEEAAELVRKALEEMLT